MIEIEQINKGPKALFFCHHISVVLKSLGGSATTTEVFNKITELFEFTQAELNEVHKSGLNVFKSNVSFAKHYMTKAGYIDSSTRGIWSLTKLGYEINFDKIDDITRLLNDYENSEYILQSKTQKYSENINPKNYTEEKVKIVKEDKLYIQLTEILKKLNPFSFERLIQRLLREAGFTKVEVTRKTNDGGIDGIGFYPINHFVSIKIIFQCKRFSGTISSPMIRDFRGAISGRAEKGLFITTSFYSKEALIEANRDGVTHIELVDSDKLYEIFKETGLGFNIEKTEVNEDFFNEYK